MHTHLQKSKTPRYSAHLGYLFTELRLRERFSAARKWGFTAIEYPSPYEIPGRQIARWLAEEGLTYTQFGLPSGDPAKGEKGIAIFPARSVEFRDSVAVALDYADEVGVSMLHPMAGICRPNSAMESNLLWDTYIGNLNYAAEAAAKRHKTILVEAMSPLAVPGYFIDTPERAMEVIAACGQGNVKLLFDVFHTAATGGDPRAFILRHGSHISHVHFADFPGRHEPGTGTLNFREIHAALCDTGFKGVYGCEYMPTSSTTDGLSWRDGFEQ